MCVKIGHVYNVYPLKIKKSDRNEIFVTETNSYGCNYGLTLTMILRDITQFEIFYYFLPIILGKLFFFFSLFSFSVRKRN